MSREPDGAGVRGAGDGVRPTPDRVSPGTERTFARLLTLALVIAIGRAVCVLLAGLWQPLLDMHGFRQSQTALSVYWLLQGGPWLAYETPVVGAPWSIPFEFPIYQWIVALVAATGVPLDGAGRLVAFAFYVATLWPLRLVFRATGLGRSAFLATAVLFMNAPLYLFWSRTFLVESCALFFACLALGLLATYLQCRRRGLALAAAAVGSVAILAKATTFPAFALVGGLLVLVDLGRRSRENGRRSERSSLVVPGLVLLLPFVIGCAWVVHTDHIKSANELGRQLTSSGLGPWNFGPLEQRLSARLWDVTLLKRVLPELFGPAVLVAAAVGGAALSRPRFALAAALAGLGFLAPLLVFTNLHIAHSYYSYANGVFALAVVGIGVAAIAGERVSGHVAAGVLLLAVLASQAVFFRKGLEPRIRRDTASSPQLQTARAVKAHTPPGSAVLVLGDDWNSVVAYYSERRALAVPVGTPPAVVARIVADPRAFLGGLPLGAIVVCRSGLAAYRGSGPAIEGLLEGRDAWATFGDWTVLEP